ncbi:carotenoid oxygenase family protein [Leptolyngbya sp. GB1-A1]|uniref:carotenoid oxygenase family protein n=1 Tax=Leptolyngbya sp. GB1-A1 TaxID=2933908 RepID=UPI0032982645
MSDDLPQLETPKQFHEIPTSVVKVDRTEISDLPLTIRKFEICNSQLAAVENEGALPEDLRGYYFVAAALAPPSTLVINGDGMIYRVELKDGKATLKTRIAKTPCYYIDQAIQNHPERYHKAYHFSNAGPSRMSRNLGNRNQLNTAFLQTRDRLLLTFDAGIPWVIDPDSMELVEPVGRMDEWLSITTPFAGLVSSLQDTVLPPHSNPAHPVYDYRKPQNDLPQNSTAESNSQSVDYLLTLNYSTGYKGKFRKSFERAFGWIRRKTIQRLGIGKGKNTPCTSRIYGFTDLIRYTFENRKLERWQLVLPDWEERNPDDDELVIGEQSIHQMAVTEDYIILMDIAFRIEFSQLFAPFTVDLIESILDWVVNILILVGKKLLPEKLRKKFKDLQADLMERRLKLGYTLYSFFLQLLPPSQITKLYIISREELRHENNPGGSLADQPKSLKVRKVTIPREVSHFAADYSNPKGKITLHIGHQNGTDVTEWISKYDKPSTEYKKRFGIEPEPKRMQQLVGMLTGAMDVSSFGRYVIDGETGALLDSKVISDVKHTWYPSVYTHQEDCHDRSSEDEMKVKNIYWMCWGFSWEIIPDRIYEAYKNKEFRVVHHTQLKESKPCKLVRLNTQTMEIEDWFDFPPGHFACSPQFIPKSTPCPEDQDPTTHGYIACVVLADGLDSSTTSLSVRPQDEFWIFDASNLGNSKRKDSTSKKATVYKLSSSDSLNIGLTIHSIWLSPKDFKHQGSLYSTPEKRQDLRQKAFWRDFGAFLEPEDEELTLGERPRTFKKMNRTVKSLLQEIKIQFIEQQQVESKSVVVMDR